MKTDSVETYRKRFDAKVKRAPSGCMEWTGARGSKGYGIMRYQGKQVRAHRLVMMLGGTELPPGMQVLHKCDNPPCVNPDHLFVGTHADNMRDASSKGLRRGGRGERNAGAKLTRAQVLEIRQIGDTVSRNECARRFGITPETVKDILCRRKWAWLP